MAFCGNCKSLVYPVEGKLACKKCGWSAEGPVVSRFLTSAPAVKARVVMEHEADVRQQQSVTCPKCGHDKAFFHLMQTRRSDEPPTQINECVKCKHSWRDYG